MKPNIAVVILAAGLGTRMESDMAKVLHPVCGKPMILYVVDTAKTIGADQVVVVVGHQSERVKAVCSASPGIKFALQAQQLGTGHAVMSALPVIDHRVEHVVILSGDVPLLEAQTVAALVADHIQENRSVTLLAVEVDNPTGYGRIIMDDRRCLAKIVEEKDASSPEKKIKLINSGIYCVEKTFLQESLGRISPDNAQQEFYLTDIIGIGYQAGAKIGVLVSDNCEETSGINTIKDLEAVERMMANRRPHP